MPDNVAFKIKEATKNVARRGGGDKCHGKCVFELRAFSNLVPFALFKKLFGSAQIIAWRVKIENVAQFVQNIFNKVGIVFLDAKH